MDLDSLDALPHGQTGGIFVRGGLDDVCSAVGLGRLITVLLCALSKHTTTLSV